MRIEKAYSTEIGELITSKRADQEFQQGNIKDKRAFQCPDRSCKAPVICANLDKKPHLRKIYPYYKVIGGHSNTCKIYADVKHPLRKRTLYEEVTYVDGCKEYKPEVRLNVAPADNVKSNFNDVIKPKKERIRVGFLSNKNLLANGQRQQTMKLSAVISSWYANEELELELPDGEVINIEDFFIKIDGQKSFNSENKMRCYYGYAWFKELTDSFRIGFADTLKINEMEAKPSFFLPHSLIKENNYPKFQMETIKQLANKKPKIVFIISENSPRIKDGFINFDCKKLEYFDYRVD